MAKQQLTQQEIDAMVEALEEFDLDRFCDEDDCDEEVVYFEDDGQPSEYEEWQDLYGGDDWDHGQYDEY